MTFTKQLAIITDDLTSATDCGIQIARSGLDTLVLLGLYEANINKIKASVISIDTDTRSAPPREAYQIVKKTTLQIRADGYKNIYKSMDSTLRGNLGIEIDAVMEVYDFDFAVVAPAFPHYGRTTVNGKHFLKEVPITQTEFANDPKNPVSEDDLVKLFSSQSKHRVGLVGLDTLRSGATAVSDQISSLRSEDVRLVVFDAKMEEDLDRIVETVSKIGCKVLWVGSTGLARCVPKSLNIPTSTALKKRILYSRNRSMLVSGSTSEITKIQIDSVRMQPRIFTLEMNPIEIICGGERAKEEIARCHSQLVNALRKGNDVALHVPTSRAAVVTTKSEGKKLGLDEEEIPLIISGALAKITKQILGAYKMRGLILTGGDTAKTVCAKLRGVGIELLEEVEPGIPLGYLVGPNELLVITKAGGFGTPQVLVNSMKKMNETREITSTH